MTNLQVAECLVDNAISYNEDGDKEIVRENLKHIKLLLRAPNKENSDFSEEDFQ